MERRVGGSDNDEIGQKRPIILRADRATAGFPGSRPVDLASTPAEAPLEVPVTEPETCPVHGDELKVELVPIQYGLPARMSDKAYGRACEERFPMANATSGGGCVISDAMPRSAPTRYCESCRRALAAWSAETGKGHGLPPDHRAFFRKYGPGTGKGPRPRAAPDLDQD